MENNKGYFGEIGHGLKTLATGMKITWKEYWNLEGVLEGLLHQ